MLRELAKQKNSFRSISVNDDNICKLLLGDDYENASYDIDQELDKYIIPHLFIPDTITEVKSHIMFETYCSSTSNTTKSLKLVVQAICHKNIVKYDNKPKDRIGLRYDVLAQYIEELLSPQDDLEIKSIMKKFEIIGAFELKSVDVFLSEKYVGRTLVFTAPCFR